MTTTAAARRATPRQKLREGRGAVLALDAGRGYLLAHLDEVRDTDRTRLRAMASAEDAIRLVEKRRLYALGATLRETLALAACCPSGAGGPPEGDDLPPYCDSLRDARTLARSAGASGLYAYTGGKWSTQRL